MNKDALQENGRHTRVTVGQCVFHCYMLLCKDTFCVQDRLPNPDPVSTLLLGKEGMTLCQDSVLERLWPLNVHRSVWGGSKLSYVCMTVVAGWRTQIMVRTKRLPHPLMKDSLNRLGAVLGAPGSVLLWGGWCANRM